MREVDLNNVDLNLLKLFDVLLKERSVTRAGQQIGLSQPAASRGLARLRKLLNDQILVRTSQGWCLTPRAVDLSEPVARLLDNARSIIAPTAFDPSTASGRFTIATADHMALLLMPILLSKIALLAPGINLEIPALSGDNVDLVAQGGADLAIGVYQDLPARFYQRALYDEDFVCILRRNHPVLSKKLTVECFTSLSHIAVIITGHGGNSVDDALIKQGASRRVAVRLPHFLAAAMLVAKSDMILTLPRRLARQISMLIPVELLELPLQVKRFTPSIIWHGRQHEDPAHKWLRKLILDIASEV